jgi:uncharacterized protein
MIKRYPEFSEFSLDLRPELHPWFQKLPEGISEFTFANLYLFRQRHQYRLSRLPQDLLLITGCDDADPFFMLPFGLPEEPLLRDLFAAFTSLKTAGESQAPQLARLGCRVSEDRDNFDYLYDRRELAELSGRKFHKKKNLLNQFLKTYSCDGRPLLDEYQPQALHILELWRQQRDDDGDYLAAREALERMGELQLCGGIYYIDGQPVGYTLGEELACGASFVIHFEKAIRLDQYKGLYQFINTKFASILPEKYLTINREQDLGDPGLRQAKESYNPVGFVKKFRAALP